MFARNAVMLVALLGLVLPEAEAAQFGNRASRASFHRHRVVFVGGFFVGPPYWYYYGGPYYYGPTYEATHMRPTLYVEKFDGTPSRDAGELYCPALQAHYPDVQECPNGWQRIIRPGQGG